MIDDDRLDDLDLDRRLGELFGGPGLDLTPRSGATATVLTRVRRTRRRRRAVQVAAPVLAAVFVTGAVLATQAGRDLGAAVPASTTGPAVTVAPDGSELAMRGTAVGGLRLGMTVAQAQATGLLGPVIAPPDDENPDCTSYSGNKGVVQVSIGRLGVAAVQVYPFIHTPQGVAVGDTYRDLHAAYPDAAPATPDTRATYRVPVPGATGGRYDFVLENSSEGEPAPTGQTRIAGLSLHSDDPSCP